LLIYRYGPTTRNSWQSYISKKSIEQLDDETPVPTKSSRAYISDSEDSEPERKRKKLKKQSKERSKSKSTKNTEKHLDLDNGLEDSKLSKDAMDGMDILHQMTQAVSTGQSVDNRTIMSDLTANDSTNMPSSSSKPTKKRSKTRAFELTDIMFPLPGALLTSKDSLVPNKRRKKSVPSSEANAQGQSKYEHLNVFLCKFTF
jgi:hypothetical protein